MNHKIKVGILGATGLIGQTYLSLLRNHPWFEIAYLASSEKSVNLSYEKSIEGRWHLPDSIPTDLQVYPLGSVDKAKQCSLLFSALPNASAETYEKIYAEDGFPIISSASYSRLMSDVPLIIPEINPDHLQILATQKQNRKWKGYIVAKPNCSIQSFMLPLTPLHRRFGIKKMAVMTMQAISGAGMSLPSHAIHDNIIPYILDEEEKIVREPLKIWGKVFEGKIVSDLEPTISAHCNRVPVLNGHFACLSIAFEKRPTRDEILDRWNHGFPSMDLPSSPQKVIHYREEPDRPQSRDCKGMEIICGRLRPCPLFDYSFIGLSHNTIRGGAGGGILIAELLKKEGFLG